MEKKEHKRKNIPYDELCDMNPVMESVLSRKRYDHVVAANDRTVAKLKPRWLSQSKRNFKHNYKPGWLLIDSCNKFALNKATICIGAGPSLKRNKQLLKELCLYNANFPFEQQPFFFIASNHQFKPCLEYGIIPHAVMWVDAADTVYDQVCKDIPRIAKNIFLIASAHCHPRLIEEWINQGRSVRYLLTQDEEENAMFEKVTGESSTGKGVLMGGNIMNCAYMSTLHCLSGRVFMATGNDLSFDIQDNIDIRRSNYYEDGDYTTNMASTRDEAAGQFKWMGFEFIGTEFHNVKPQINLKPKATVQSLYTYKTWIESQVVTQDALAKNNNVSFHYYNCSEASIVGVLCRGDDPTDLNNMDNWFLLDEVLPNRWHTRTLKDATTQFLAVREQIWQNENKARGLVEGVRVSSNAALRGVSLSQ